MKTLFILRHAKAISEEICDDDHARTLSERGQEACVMVGEFLREFSPAPEVIHASTSARTKETAERIIETLKLGNLFPRIPEITLYAPLYLATPGTLLYHVAQLPDTLSSVMLVGHNPGMHVTAQELARRGDKGAIRRLRENFPTTALAIIQFNTDKWANAHADGGELVEFVTPKELTPAN